MFAVCVTFTIAAGKLTEFMPLMHQQATQSLKSEDDCKRFDVCSGGNDENRVFLYELYTDRAAFDLHLQSPHFKAFDTQVSPMVIDKQVELFTQFFTGNDATMRSE